MDKADGLLVQLDKLLGEYEQLREASRHNDLSDQPKDVRQALVTRAIATVVRVTGNTSPYMQEIRRLQGTSPALHTHTSQVIGVARAVRDDLQDGHLKTLMEIAHADVFGDLLGMASHLLEAGYKDAAAVVVGSTLESHLRHLCIKHGIGPNQSGGKSDGRPKKLDRLNADLAKASVYGKLDQKSVTAWADLRNKAAHGHYDKYETAQVHAMMVGVTDFVRRLPA